MIIHIEGFDWNCPKYITPRDTREDFELETSKLKSRIAELELEMRSLRTR
jgi:uncharacterized protein